MIATTPKSLSRAALVLALALPVAATSGWARAQEGEPAGERPPRVETHAEGDARRPGAEGANDEESAAESRATGFRAVDGAQVEDVPGGLMLVGAYGAIAILLLAFLLRQQSQLGALATRIDALRSEIDAKRGGDGAP